MPSPIRIVLVDDAPDVRALLRTRLRLSGRFQVVGEGGTGAEAVEAVRELDPDLLVLDVSMPDMDGLDALVRVREVAPRTRIVMFSGFEEEGLAERARELGAVAFLEKSTPIEHLPDQLAALCADPPPETGTVTRTGVDPVLQEHLERFRAAFDQAAIGMATLTLTGRIVRGNTALDALLGTVPEGLVGLPYADAAEAPAAELRAAVREVASGERTSASIEHGLPDGRTVLASLSAVRDSGARRSTSSCRCRT